MYDQKFDSQYSALQAIEAAQKLAVVRVPGGCEITERFGILNFAPFYFDPQQFELLRTGHLSEAHTPDEFAKLLCVLKRVPGGYVLEPFKPNFVKLSSDLRRQREELNQLRRDDEDDEDEDEN